VTGGRTSKIRSPIVILVAFLLVINVLWIAASALRSDTLREGTAAPDAVLERLDGAGGGGQKLSDLWKGKGAILVFWNTWCSACQKELVALSRSLGEIPGGASRIVGVNLDQGTRAHARLFVKEKKLPFLTLHDAGGVADLYRVSTLPTLYIVGADGTICYAATGYTRVSRIASESRACGGGT
jgi:peroxiredoxin